MTQAERIALLELEVSYLKEEVRESNRKLDELLTLKNKGMGAFALVSLILGTGAVGVIIQIISWVRGH